MSERVYCKDCRHYRHNYARRMGSSVLWQDECHAPGNVTTTHHPVNGEDSQPKEAPLNRNADCRCPDFEATPTAPDASDDDEDNPYRKRGPFGPGWWKFWKRSNTQ